eukprot:7965382-Ditylum_brightwellii.AAC.1
MEGTVQEKVAPNKKYFEQFNTTADFAKYDIQLCVGNPNAWYKGKKIETNALGVYARLNYSYLALDLIQDIAGLIGTKSVVKFVLVSLKFDKMIKDNMEKYKNLLWEQNAYLVSYADFHVNGITEEMLEQEVVEPAVKENILISPFITDIHETTFTINKDAEYFHKSKAFPAPWVIPTYGITYKYTEQITYDVSTIINENEKKCPPSNAWSRGPPKAMKQVEQNDQ